MRCPFCAVEIEDWATACRACGATRGATGHWTLSDEGYAYAHRHRRSRRAVRRALLVAAAVALVLLAVFGIQQANQDSERDACREVRDGAVSELDC